MQHLLAGSAGPQGGRNWKAAQPSNAPAGPPGISHVSQCARRYPFEKLASDAACQQLGMVGMLNGGRRAEFARLLALAFTREKEVRAQQAFIRDMIMEGNRDAIWKEWDELTNLLVETEMLSRSLRAVFDK